MAELQDIQFPATGTGQQRALRQSVTTQAVCKRCKQLITPVEDTYPSWKTHVIAGILFIIGLPFCVFIPYCFDCFGKEVMRCPRCGCYMNS